MDRRFLRPAWVVGHVLVLLAALVCLRLGWWQWNRSHEANGTVQNLGYAILWPCFAGAFIFMWLRFIQLERLKDDEQAAELAAAEDADELPGSAEGAGLRVVEDHGSGSPDVQAAAAEPDPAAFAGPDRNERGGAGPPAADSPPRPAAGDDAADGGTDQVDPDAADQPARSAVRAGRCGSRGVVISVAHVDDEGDPELAAYNQALADLAERDRRRAR